MTELAKDQRRHRIDPLLAGRPPLRSNTRRDLYIPRHIEVESAECSTITSPPGLGTTTITSGGFGTTTLADGTQAVTTIETVGGAAMPFIEVPIEVHPRRTDEGLKEYLKGSHKTKNKLFKCLPRKLRKRISKIRRRRKDRFLFMEAFDYDENGSFIEEERERKLREGIALQQQPHERDAPSSAGTAYSASTIYDPNEDPALQFASMVTIALVIVYILCFHCTIQVKS